MVNGKPRPVLLGEQIFPIAKKNALDMMDDLIKLLRALYIKPEHFIMDKTGNGLVFHDGMKKKFGNIWGVQWAAKPTDKKILDEDTMTAEDQFKNIISEMWFSASRWLEFGYCKFSPTMPTQRLFLELTSRKYGKFHKVETKADFKKRTKRRSPDYADSWIMLIHLCRMMNAFDRPQIIDAAERPSTDFVVGIGGGLDGDTVEMVDTDSLL
jgi:hypothetical protein